MAVAGLLSLFITLVAAGVTVLVIYTLVLAIRALKIYIEKNGR